MPGKNFGRELASYVALALATIGSANAQDTDVLSLAPFSDSSQSVAGSLLTLTLDSLTTREIASLETMVAKYQEVARFLPLGKTLASLEVAADPTGMVVPGSKIPKGVDPRVAAVSKDQLDLAVQVYQLVEETAFAHSSGRIDEARATYDTLVALLEDKRQTLYGGFETIDQLEETAAAFSTAQGNDVNAVDGGLVIFVIIEIYVS